VNRPKKDEARATAYLVETAGYIAGSYVGETDTHVVLRVGDTIKGFPWREVTPVVLGVTD
jgi:fructose 1,6-bisphosphatase